MAKILTVGRRSHHPIEILLRKASYFRTNILVPSAIDESLLVV